MRAAAEGPHGVCGRVDIDGIPRRTDAIEVCRECVERPLPYVARHVVQADRVRRVLANRRRGGVLLWKVAGVDVRLRVCSVERLVAPRVLDVRLAAASREFPLRFRREARTGPGGERNGVVPGHVNDRMIVEPFY